MPKKAENYRGVGVREVDPTFALEEAAARGTWPTLWFLALESDKGIGFFLPVTCIFDDPFGGGKQPEFNQALQVQIVGLKNARITSPHGTSALNSRELI